VEGKQTTSEGNVKQHEEAEDEKNTIFLAIGSISKLVFVV
jgi:hypothetical protein